MVVTHRRIVGTVLVLACSHASADDTPGSAARASSGAGGAPSSLEAGIFTGGFISNYFHQFYDDHIEGRQTLERVSPLVGLRCLYSPTSWLGFEAETVWIKATTSDTQDAASIFGLRAQAVFQHRGAHALLPERVVPFASVGAGIAHLSSDPGVLGSDTDLLLQIGAGVRVFATRSIAFRAEGRFLRGPSQQAPYDLNASYGEVLFGVSFVPDLSSESKPVVAEFVDAPRDSDGDGVADSQDRCPTEVEDRDLYEDSDGCPDPDNDGDGIADLADACVLEPEDPDGFADHDGCPDKDNDGDGIADAHDGCRGEAEDVDGFHDADGCADPDNDEDGVLDIADACPAEVETINGVDDEDGCPDAGDAAVVLSPDRIELFSPIAFAGDRLAKSSVPVLSQVGAMLRRYRQILRLRITVHVQPTKHLERDQDLSDQRAAAIRDWLVDWGIDAKRLEVRGFGSSKPLVPASQRGSAQLNNRVELIILERQ